MPCFKLIQFMSDRQDPKRWLQWLLYGILLHCTPAMSSNPIVSLEQTDVRAFVRGLMEGVMGAHQIPGGVVAIIQGDDLIMLEGFGLSDVDRALAVNPHHTMFRVASISKPFIWLSILKLRDHGALDLGIDVNRYLDFAIPDTFPGQPITLHHLMTHSAGFEDVNIGASVRTLNRRESLSDTLQRMLPLRAEPPGLRTAYSNYGTALAGLIVERIAGEDLPAYLAQAVFHPADMTSTTIEQPPSEKIKGSMSKGYTRSGDALVELPFEHMNLYPNGALSTTASDMARFAASLIGNNTNPWKLSDESWDSLWERQFGNIPQVAGLSYGFMQMRWAGHEAIGHGGDIAGFKSQFVIFPQFKIAIFLSFNTDQTRNATAEILSAFALRYFPKSEKVLFSDAQVDDALEPPDGAYVPSRRNRSNIEKLFWPMAMGLTISRVSETDLDIDFFGAKRRYSSVGLGVYLPARSELGRSDEFGALLARKSPRSGDTELFLSNIGSFMFERALPHESLPLHGKMIVLVIFCLSFGLLSSIFGGTSRHRSGRKYIPLILSSTGGFVSLISLPLLAIRFTPELVYGVDTELRIVLALPLISILLIAAALISSAFVPNWRPKGLFSLSMLLSSTGVILLAWQLHIWNLLGFTGVPT